jgi:hypothetical protein
MWWLARLREIKKPFIYILATQKEYTPKHAVARATLLLAVFTVALTVFEYIHIKGAHTGLGSTHDCSSESGG